MSFIRNSSGVRRDLCEAEPGDHGFDAKNRSGTHPKYQSDAKQREDRALLAVGRRHRQHQAKHGGNPEPAQSSVHDLLTTKSVTAQFARPPHDREWQDSS